MTNLSDVRSAREAGCAHHPSQTEGGDSHLFRLFLQVKNRRFRGDDRPIDGRASNAEPRRAGCSQRAQACPLNADLSMENCFSRTKRRVGRPQDTNLLAELRCSTLKTVPLELDEV
jgi:hypothetical protein